MAVAQLHLRCTDALITSSNWIPLWIFEGMWYDWNDSATHLHLLNDQPSLVTSMCLYTNYKWTGEVKHCFVCGGLFHWLKWLTWSTGYIPPTQDFAWTLLQKALTLNVRVWIPDTFLLVLVKHITHILLCLCRKSDDTPEYQRVAAQCGRGLAEIQEELHRIKVATHTQVTSLAITREVSS